MNVINQIIKNDYAIYHGDSVEIIKGIPDESIHYSIFSPPFLSLFTYSNSDRDMGNCKKDKDFITHFQFLAKSLFRVMKTGRLVSIHCSDIPAMKERDGFIGLKDFPAMVRRIFEKAGFIYHSKIAIWKDPLIEAVRTKSIGLMHKQIEKDSTRCRQGLPDYIVTMVKYGENKEPVSHKGGFKNYYGEKEPKEVGIKYSHNVWRKYASPIWMDINQTNTLNVVMAREKRDERHICPLQLDVILRCLVLWSNENDIILSPFMGIGSEGVGALQLNRKFIGIELKESYFREASKNLKMIKNKTGFFKETEK